MQRLLTSLASLMVLSLALACAPPADPVPVPPAAAASTAPSTAATSTPPTGAPAASSDAAPAADAQAPAKENSATVGDLLVAPTRLIFEGNRRSAEVTLVNIGPTAATYRISFIHLEMNEAGELVEIEEPPPGMKIAEPLVRFSPRQVRLEPNVAQTVRIQLRKPADLERGEYRSHMLFRAVPPPEELSVDPEDAPETGISIRLIPIYGVSIPLIIRHETDDSAANLSNLAFDPPADSSSAGSLTARISRAGDQSVYGNLKVIHHSPSGEAREVGFVGGVAVYPPLPSRSIRIPLRAAEGVDLDSGRLVVTYTGEPPQEVRLAEAELALR
ncbi:MAG: fimbria/pilus periplasmic chaperone [Acidobacteria bacterium]|nr:fimbria/pilus periplasmic chaperone [Acidobacteriota bacterium]